MMSGSSAFPLALMHSMAVTIMRLKLPPLPPCCSFFPTRTFAELSMLSMTPVSSMLYTFSGSIEGSCSTWPITSNYSTIFSCILLL
jgi:hypothetical protein